MPILCVYSAHLASKANNRMTMAEFVKETGGNQNTPKVRLRELLAAGRINRHGKGRATWYTGK